MSQLVLLLPGKPRLHPSRDGNPAPASSVAELDYALAADRRGIRDTGRLAPALLPERHASEVIAVLPDAAVSWHRITVPKAPPSRLRAALVGVLEEALLEDPEQLHLALEPGATAGQMAWVAATDKAWLAGQLASLEASGLMIDRVVPLSWPGAHVMVHIESAVECGDAQLLSGPPDKHLRLTWAHQDGVLQVPVGNDGTSAVLIQAIPEGTRIHATPLAAVAAERWAQRPVTVVRAAERWLWAARNPWNLRQFDLAPSRRGLAQLRSAWSAFRSTAWRPVRYGLVTLAVVQILGLNIAAWQQRSELTQMRAQMTQLLRTAHPQVKAILDVPLQMQRETEALRVMAGQAGEGDLESLLQSVASTWPPGQAVQGLRYESGQLTVATNGLPPPEQDRIEQLLRASGLQVDTSDGRMSLRPLRRANTAPR